MKKIFGSLFKSSASTSSNHVSNNNNIALITNYNSCPLGLSLTQRLSQDYKVVAVSYN